MKHKSFPAGKGAFSLSPVRLFLFIACLLPILLFAFWLLRVNVSPVFAAFVDWPAIGWNDAGPAGPATQSFTNVDGTGIDLDVTYSGNMWDGVPNIYAAAAPVPPLETALRWTNNQGDTGGAPGTANGPSTMELVFSEPVLLDEFTVGSLSLIGTRYEWAEVRAFDNDDNLLLVTGINTSTHDVDAAGGYTGIIQVPGAPLILDDSSGVYLARGTSLQADCDDGCGYDRATFVYNGTPVKRVEVIQFATDGPDATSSRSSGQASIVLEAIEFRPAGIAQQGAPAAVGNRIWLDENANGRQDPGEPGIPNVIVNLTDGGGAVITTTTDSRGGYLFRGLDAGAYTVTLPPQNFDPGGALENMAQSPNPTLPGADFGNQTLPYAVTLTEGAENLTADFGFVWNPDGVNNDSGSGAIGDRVWVDVDGDGAQDAGEPGLPGVTVTLFAPGPDGRFGTPDDAPLNNTITDANGRYAFPDLPPAAYVVCVDDTTLPAGYIQSGDPDDFGQPAAAPDHCTTAPIILAPGDTFLNADFGYAPDSAPVGRIGDFVWFDADASGAAEPADPGEFGIAGVTVALILDADGDGSCADPGSGAEPIIATAVTDAGGRYLFDGLPLDPGGADTGYLVWVNDTDNVLAGLTQTFDFDGVGTPNCSARALNLAAPQQLDQDFSYTPPDHNPGDGLIGDTVWLNKNGDGVQDADEPGLAGVRVTLTLSDTTTLETITDKNGRYFFGGLDPTDTYTVTIAPDNFDPGGVLQNLANTADPDGAPDNETVVDLAADGPVTLDQDFGYTPPAGEEACIGNLVWLDPNADGIYDDAAGDEPAIAGVTVDLYRDLNGNGQLDPGERLLETAVTSATPTDNGCFTGGDLGNYLFTGLPAGDYVVRVSDANGVLTGYWQSRGADGLSDNSQANPYALSVAAGSDNLTADFGYYVTPAALGNRTWIDENENGLQDPGEPPLPNVLVRLTITYPDNTVITLRTRSDSSGFYSFPNLLLDEDFNGDGSGPEPAFVLSAQTPFGYRSTLLNVGGNGRIDADDPNGVTAQPVQGQNDVTPQTDADAEADVAAYDFGFVADDTLLAALGNRVWLDENSNGRQDPGEPGIPNVTLNLTNAAGVTTTTVTDARGGYLFPDLPPGTYTVTLNSATLPAGVTQTANPTLPLADFGNQTLPYVVTLGGGAENLTADFGFIWNPNGVNSNSGNGAIGDRVWLDGDGDGVQDPDEAGIPGVTVRLLAPGPDGLFGTTDDPPPATTTTDGSGRYAFDNLPPGAYVVQVDETTLPAGVTQTGDPDDFGQPAAAPDNQTTMPIVLAPGDTFLNADFGYQPAACGTIGDTVWFDADASGTAVVDAGEFGIGRVTVSLIADSNGDGIWNANETIIATTTTDANGNYLFSCLLLDDGGGDAGYLVWVNDTHNVLYGLAQTFDADGVGTPNLSAVTLSAAAPDDLDQDFSYTAAGHTPGDGLIGDTIWLDVNGDGVQDADEPGLEGVLVTLTLPDGSTAATVTNENGRYAFGNLDPNETYTVTVTTGGVLAGLVNSSDPDGGDDNRSAVDLSAGGPINLDQDFGYTPAGAQACIGNLIWLDGNADGVYDPATETVIGGVTVDVYRDLNGNGLLDAGEPLVQTAVSTDTATDNGCYPTGDPGNYVVPGLPAGNYVVRVSDAGGVLLGYWQSLGAPGATNESQTGPYALSVSAGSDNLTADFGYYVVPAALGNFAWDDADGNGIQDPGEAPLAGVTVTLQIDYPSGAVITLRTLSDANGFYSFGNLLLDEDFNGAGTDEPTFTLSALPPGDFVPTQTDVNANGNDLEDSDDPFGVAAQPVQGQTGTALQANPIDEPLIASYDFGFHAPLRVGNRVWHDLDDDGLFEPLDGEAGIPGVVLALLDTNGDPLLDIRTGLPFTATTNADGFYSFDAVSTGEVIVSVDESNFANYGDPLFGFVSANSRFFPDPGTDPNNGVDDDDNGVNNPYPAAGGVQSLPLTLLPGAAPLNEVDEEGAFPDADSDLTLDFGFFELLTVGDRVWFDADDNGIFDSNESGAGPGVVLNLLDVDGNPVLNQVTGLPITTTTIAGGFYYFSPLFPGEYRVQLAAENFQDGGILDGFRSSTGSADPNENEDNRDKGVPSDDPAAEGITSGVISLAFGAEPAGGADGDDNANTNLTLDFGVLLDQGPTAVTLLSFTATNAGQGQVRLNWETAAETENFGFRLYRGETADFAAAVQIHFTPSALPGGSGPGAAYSYLDGRLASGTYTYWLVDVDMGGALTVHDPVTVAVSPQTRIFLPLLFGR